jgi:hypothetical protein
MGNKLPRRPTLPQLENMREKPSAKPHATVAITVSAGATQERS